MRYMLSDDLWAVMGPLVERAKRHTSGQPPRLADRMFFEAVLYWARTGVPWRDLPGEFGEWDAVYNRLRRWVYSGGLTALFELLTAGPGAGRGPAGDDRLDDRPRPPARGRGGAKKKRLGAGR